MEAPTLRVLHAPSPAFSPRAFVDRAIEEFHREQHDTTDAPAPGPRVSADSAYSTEVRHYTMSYLRSSRSKPAIPPAEAEALRHEMGPQVDAAWRALVHGNGSIRSAARERATARVCAAQFVLARYARAQLTLVEAARAAAAAKAAAALFVTCDLEHITALALLFESGKAAARRSDAETIDFHKQVAAATQSLQSRVKELSQLPLAEGSSEAAKRQRLAHRLTYVQRRLQSVTDAYLGPIEEIDFDLTNRSLELLSRVNTLKAQHNHFARSGGVAPTRRAAFEREVRGLLQEIRAQEASALGHRAEFARQPISEVYTILRKARVHVEALLPNAAPSPRLNVVARSTSPLEQSPEKKRVAAGMKASVGVVARFVRKFIRTNPQRTSTA